MIVDFRYDYWGDNGRCYESMLEEYETEREAITDLSSTAFYNAIDDTLKVQRVIGGEEGALERIREGIAADVAERVRQKRMAELRRFIEANEKWFDGLGAEIAKRRAAIEEHRATLVELEAADVQPS